MSLTCLSASSLVAVAVRLLLLIAWTLRISYPLFLAKPRLDSLFFGRFNPSFGFSCRFDVCSTFAVWTLFVPAHALSAVLLSSRATLGRFNEVFVAPLGPPRHVVRVDFVLSWLVGSYSWPTKIGSFWHFHDYFLQLSASWIFAVRPMFKSSLA